MATHFNAVLILVGPFVDFFGTYSRNLYLYVNILCLYQYKNERK